MRRRLLLSTLAVAVIAVLLLGVPLGVVNSRLVFEEARQRLQRDANAVASEVQFRLDADQQVTSALLARTYPDRFVRVQLPDRRVVEAGRRPVGSLVSAEARSADGSRIVVSEDADEVREDAVRSLLLIATIGMVAVGAAVGLAIVQARRLALPLVDLAETAERLGSGEARPRHHRYGMPELDRVSQVLDRSAVRIADLLAAEREFASDASHQLRTPLAALSMRLEEMIAAADDPDVVREEGAAALAQTERLTDVVGQLLAHVRRSRSGATVPTKLDEVIRQQVEEWEPAFRRAGRSLRVAGEEGLTALATPGGLAQVLATLIDNALVHGDGTVTIRTNGGARSVLVEVSDEGQGVPQELVPRVFERSVSGSESTGLGLALARALAEADGGRLELVKPRPPVFSLFLRPVPDPGTLPARRVVSGPA